MSENQTAAESHRKKLQAFPSKSVAELAGELEVTKVTVYRWLKQLGMMKEGKKRRVKAGKAARAEKPTNGHTDDKVSETEKDIRTVCSKLAEMLIAKNAVYGDSALSPMRLFSQADPVEQLRVRIDDKLNRLLQGKGSNDESLKDTRHDLMGYLVLLEIAEVRAKRA